MSLTGKRFGPVEDRLHGVVVQDPYRWLEDRTLPETEEWIREQRRRTDAYFAECHDLTAIRQRVRKYCDIEMIDHPAKIGDRYFYRLRAPGEEQGRIYVRDGVAGVKRLLVDPSAEGPFVSVGIYRISADGGILAYERKEGGEDKSSIRMVDVRTGATLPSAIEKGYARGFGFSPENRGFFYCHACTNEDQHTVRFHAFDDSPAEHVVFRVERSRRSRLTLLADSAHLGVARIHEVGGELVQDLWISERRDPTIWHRVLIAVSMPCSLILSNGRVFALRYDRASDAEVAELTLDGNAIRTIIREEGSTTRQVMIAGSTVYIHACKNSRPVLRSSLLSGRHLPDISLPENGTIELLPNFGDGSSLFLSYESFACPQTIFEYVPDSGALFSWTKRSLGNESSSVTVRHTSYRSFDGTEIPVLFAGHRLGKTGSPSPVIMTSDGGFGVSLAPRFSILVSLLLECGAVFVVPFVRGSGALGEAWHDAGRRRKKQNSFDDFIAAAEWLCTEGITTAQQIAIFGASNAGLLAGVALTRRPDLFTAVVCIAPLLDMVRYEHFDQAENWKEEYGTCDDEQDFRALYAYSPYHHVSASTQYPSILFIAGDKDDRCNPAHVRKMAAHLLRDAAPNASVLVDYSTERGHVPAMPVSAKIEALGRRVAFLCRELKLPLPKGEH